MKKYCIIIIAILFSCFTISAGIYSSVGFSEELSYSRFNHSPYQADEVFPNRFKTTSIMLNSNMSHSFDYCITDSVGLCIKTGFGYDFSLFDIDRFASIPNSLNGNISLGPTYSFGNHKLFLTLGLKSSFFTDNNYWVSQIGSTFGYIFNMAYTKISLYVSYWYNTNYRSITTGVSILLGN